MTLRNRPKPGSTLHEIAALIPPPRGNESLGQVAILNALSAHVALLDSHGFIVTVNDAWRQFASANGLPLPGCGIGLDYLGTCDRARGDNAAEAHEVAAGIRSVLSGAAKTYSIEYPCNSPTEQRWFQLTATPMAGYPPSGAVVMHLDVTARRQSEERARLIVESALDAVVTMDATGRITGWNQHAETTFGWPREQALGMLLSNTIIPARYREAHERGIRAFLEGGEGPILNKRIEISALRRNGHEFPVELTVSPLRVQGAWIFNAFIRDLSEQKRVDEVVQRFLAAMEVVSDAIYLVDRTSMTFIHVNATACRMRGQTRKELMALGPAQVLGVSRAELERSYDSIIDSGVEPPAQQMQRTRQDGSEVWVELRRHALRAGERWTIVTLVRDISEQKRVADELHNSELRFRSLTKLSSDWFWAQDEQYRFVQFSGGDIDEKWGRDQSATLGQRRWELSGVTPVSTSWDEHRALLEAHQPFRNFEYQRILASGQVQHIAASGEPVFDASGRFTGYRGVANDITQRKQADERIRRLNRVYAVMSGINALIVRVRERDALFREACQIAVEHGRFMTAWIGLVDRSTMKLLPVASAGAQAEFLALNRDRFPLGDDALPGRTMAARAVREKAAVVSNDIRDDPRVAYAKEHLEQGISSIAAMPLLVADEVVGVFSLYAVEAGFFDDEEMKLLTELSGNIAFAIDHLDKQDRLNYLAYYDPLTGLANRGLFLDRVTQHLRSAASAGGKVALSLVDLERFKNINDSLGRPLGDALLVQVAQWLTQYTGDASLVGRLDADHFAVLLPQVRPQGNLARLLESTTEAFQAHPFRLGESVFRIAAKTGVALFPDDGSDADTLFKHAEAALKKAKAGGSKYVFYTPQMTEAVAGKLTLENQLRRALDNEEFVLHYQPKVNLASGKVTSAEALIRWNDPRTGLVPPGKFIPILEEIGLILEVGRWAVRQAIADYLRWRSAGLPVVRIAVNVSPLQLRHPGFIGEIGQAIGVEAHAAQGLELEITESLIMEDVKHNIASLKAIRAMGVTIAIDDFGTGFSSLAYLAKLPVDTLKIDRSFIVDMTSGPQGLALVSTIINLAHSLKLKVVAEAVETEEQSRLLRLLRCDEMQGYLFSKPVASDVFEARFLGATTSEPLSEARIP